MSNTPIDDSYWLVPGRLLAGEYPGAKTKGEAQRKLRSFLDAGVDLFLDLTDEGAALEEGWTVYVHCWGGIGRTGTVLGCYLVEHEVSVAEALAEIQRRRRGTKDGWKKSPQTQAQLDFVKRWCSFASQGHPRERARDSYKVA